jgi:hypothetical protein
VRRTVVLRVTGIVLAICVAGGMLAATGAAEPVTQSAAGLANNVKKALRIGKRADKKATSALTVARRAEKAAVAGRQGPAGAAGLQGERGAQGAAGSNGSNGSDGATGPAGATGATGATGPKGTTDLWEVFGATSSSASHVRGTASGQGWLGNGTYFVSFAPKDISGCAYTATVGSISDELPVPRIATVEHRAGFPTDIRVRSWDLTGSLASPTGTVTGFHVAVFCP